MDRGNSATAGHCQRFNKCSCGTTCAQVHWHNEKGEQVSVHSVRLPKDSVMKDVTDELRRMLPDTAGKAKNLRLIEIYFSKIYKVGFLARPHTGKCRRFDVGV